MADSIVGGCLHPNPESARFCSTCGQPLTLQCSRCGAELSRQARFCSQCGHAVSHVSANDRVADTSSATATAAPMAGGERRQLSVMFSDLVGSTELASRMDPEEYQELVGTYYAACGDAVRAHDGHLAQLLGDGVLAYFGYPLAHEDSARRAVLAALDTQRALAGLAASCTARFGVAPSARVGIHTGVVVVAPVNAGERHDTVALGDAMNVAARVQSLAEPDTVVVTGTTHRLIADAFAFDDLGTHALRGVPEPVAVYRVHGVLDSRRRRAATARSRRTPFVGRGRELEQLRQRWDLARTGQGHALVLTGEPGIGKSRLLGELRAVAEIPPARWVEISASPEMAHTPFGMLRLLLEEELGWGEDLAAPARLEHLERHLDACGIAAAVAARALGGLLDLPVEERYGRTLATAEQQRRQLIDSLVHWLRCRAPRGSLLLVCEDLHWADPSTLETLGLLMQRIAGDPVLVVMTARSDFVVPWGLGPRDLRLTLSRLSAGEVRDIVAHVAANLGPAGEMLEALVQRTDGVPLFAEELARAVFERRDDRVAAESVPLTLQDSLAARLDRLGPAKEIAQVSAVIGRTFPRSLLARLLPAATDLDAGLASLAAAGVLEMRGEPAAATYQFSHALMQQAAYDSLLKRRRRELHAAVAQTIGGDGASEILAYHWTAAGDGERATTAWVAAAEQAFARSAFLEAGTHLAKAIEALLLLPESPERAGRELELQLRRAVALQYGKGFVVPEVEAAMARARQLGEHIGNAEQRLSTLHGLWVLSLSRGEIAAAGELADQILAIATAEAQPTMLAQALSTRAGSCLHLCDLPGAIDCADRAMAIPLDEHAVSALSHGALLYGGLALALTGCADQARQRCVRLRDLRDAPGMLPFALVSTLTINVWLREVDAVLVLDEELRRVTEAWQVPLFTAWGWIYGGWAKALRGRCDEGIDELRRGLAEHVASGQRLGFTQYLCLLAEAHLAAGAVEEGLAAVDDALGARVTEERWHHAELWRVRGALRAAGGEAPAAVEADYREAIDTARRDGTRLFERRAATALARMLAGQGRAGEARALLAPLQASFCEGLDTSDHRDAASVLAAL